MLASFVAVCVALFCLLASTARAGVAASAGPYVNVRVHLV